MNTQRKHEILNELDTMRKQVELLDSYKTLEMANDKQYAQSLIVFQNRLSELERESGVDYDTSVNGKLNLISDKMDEIRKSLKEIAMMYQSLLGEADNEEVYL